MPEGGAAELSRLTIRVPVNLADRIEIVAKAKVCRSTATLCGALSGVPPKMDNQQGRLEPNAPGLQAAFHG